MLQTKLYDKRWTIIYFFFNSSGTNIVCTSTTHAIKAMRKIGAQDIPIESMNHPENGSTRRLKSQWYKRHLRAEHTRYHLFTRWRHQRAFSCGFFHSVRFNKVVVNKSCMLNNYFDSIFSLLIYCINSHVIQIYR